MLVSPSLVLSVAMIENSLSPLKIITKNICSIGVHPQLVISKNWAG